MARKELYSTDTGIDQLDALIDDGSDDDRTPEIVLVDPEVATKDYQDALAFNENPVTILIAPGIEENAAQFQFCQVNGKGAEVLINRRWVSFGHLPVGQVLTTKRKYLEVLIRSKRNGVVTTVIRPDGEDPINKTTRPTASVMAITLVEDRNPRGVAWFQEMIRRQL